MNNKQKWTLVLLGAALLFPPLQVRSFAQWMNFGPGLRDQHSAVYDPTTSSMIVFGGQNTNTVSFNDVWLAEAVNTTVCAPCELQWSFLSPTGTPPTPRYGHSAVYDPSSNHMMVFGGATGFPSPCSNQLWDLENANGTGGTPSWTIQKPSGTPPAARYGHGAGYDPNRNHMVIFGGSNCSGGYDSDTWILSNANSAGVAPGWSPVSITGSEPPARTNMAVGYNPTDSTLVMFGGYDGTELSDVWILNIATAKGKESKWKQITPAGPTPPARYAAAYAFDTTNNILMIQGGMSATGILGDSWVLNNADGVTGTPTWVQITFTTSAPVVWYQSGVFIPASDELVIFGGITEQAPTPSTAVDYMFGLIPANNIPIKK